MDPRRHDSSPYSSDPSSVPFAMPMPDIVVQMPRSDVPGTSHAYGQPYASGYPCHSDHTSSSDHLHPPEYSYVSEGTYVSMPSEPRVGAWVPSVPGLSDEAEVNPMSEPILLRASEPNVFEQAFDALSQISEYYPSKSHISAWVPSVPQSDKAEATSESHISAWVPSVPQSDEAEAASEPICIYTQEAGSVPQSQSILRKPSRLRRLASFLRMTRS